MAYDYARLRDEVAQPLIENYGTALLLHRIEDTTEYVKHYDPVTMTYYWEEVSTGDRIDTEPLPVQQTYTGSCVIQRYRTDQIDGVIVQADDLRLVAAGIPKPQEGDVYTVAGVDYQFVRVDAVSPGAVDLIYKIQVRV